MLRGSMITMALMGAFMVTSAAQADLSPEERLLDQVYAEGGTLLYCQSTFSHGDRTRVDRIYPTSYMLSHFGCRSARMCEVPAFSAAFSDLHNLFPISRRSDVDRRGTLFAQVPESITESECGYRVAFQNFEPPLGARGPVARAMLYMHVQHDLPLVGVPDMYQTWSNEDPPTEEEIQRNIRIGEIQGNRNPYIDDPNEVNNIVFDLF